MGIETKPNSDKKVTQPSKAQQAELPLRRATDKTAPSKLLFQVKSELNRLQQRDKEWKLMFQMLGHDLKEPLVTLEGFTKLLEEEPTDSKNQRRYLRVIREAINSLHLLVASLQSVSKMTSHPQELVDVQLLEILSNVRLSLAEQIQRTKAQVQVDCAESLWLKGDPVRLFQIFLNLVSNSLKYHKKESDPVIKIEARKVGDNLRVSISDNGVGMTPEDLKKIFEPFTRLDSTSATTEGLGMGLSIVKKIAESFGGRILVKSQANVGTTFTVFLPRTPLVKGAKKI